MVSPEEICGNCKFFKPYTDQPPAVLIEELGRKGACNNLYIPLTYTFEESDPKVIIRSSPFKGRAMIYDFTGRTCFRDKNFSQIDKFLL